MSMPEKPPTANWCVATTELLKKLSSWRGGVAVIVFIFGLALVTRMVNLSSFPYFPPDWPWNGVGGLYFDEVVISNLPSSNTPYFPFLQVALIGLAIQIFGKTIFAVRLVSALFSSTTCVLVYLSAFELFHRRAAAIISSLYFIFMTPALVYGRMAFVENGATTFFMATFLFAIKFSWTSNNRWLVLSGISAALSFLCKQTGLAAIIFLALFVLIYKPEAKRQLLELLFVMGALLGAYIIQIMIVNPAYLDDILKAYIFTLIGSVSWFTVFLCNLMPTGINLSWIQFPQTIYKDLYRFVTLDFWYVVAFFVIVYLMVKERKAVSEVVLAMVSFVLLLILIGHTNAYYVILVQPFMAIPIGYGLLKVQEMSGAFSFAFSLLLCFPVIAYINYYVSYFVIGNTTVISATIIQLVIVVPVLVAAIFRFVYEKMKQKEVVFTNRVLVSYYVAWLITGLYILLPEYSGADAVWVAIQFSMVIPVVIVGIFRLIYERMRKKEAIFVNRFLLVFYFGCLVVGSYVVPVFYPGYFAQSSILG